MGKTKGKKVQACIRCGSEWICTGPGGMGMLCEDCYNEMHAEVVQYHTLQDLAEHAVIEGDVDRAVALLREAIVLRNTNMQKFFGFSHKGHSYYANVFLPSLIEAILSCRDPYNAWVTKFKELEEAHL
jgi:hypothetical protein